MLPKSGRVTPAAVVLVLLVAALTLIPMPGAVAVTSHKPLNDTRPVSAAPVEVDFPIQYFGVVADLAARADHLPEQGPAPYGAARFRVDGEWTEWRAFSADGAQAAGQFTSALLSVDDADAYQVRGLPSRARNWQAAAINTTDGPEFVVDEQRAGAANAAPSCRSRADWGADESISGWEQNGDTQAFSPAQFMTVHHTAGSNNPNQNYAATVRAIYSYHVQTNGWSDIGYQYLVDRNGVVYEGRSTGHTSTSCLYDGGDGSDFAHHPDTDEVVTAAHTKYFNTGNLGVSLMGCYQPSADRCTGDTEPSALQVDALEAKLALLADRHGIDPEGTVHYVNPVNGRTKDVDAISGHRDNGSTSCPGIRLYEQLPAIRSDVAGRVNGDAPMDSAVVSFNRKRRWVREDAGTLNLLVWRSGNTESAASVGYAKTAGNARSGDYNLPGGTLEFAPGEEAGTIPLEITDDALTEGRERIIVSLRDPGTGTVIGTPSSFKVVVRPSDQQPDGWISNRMQSRYVGDDVFNTTGFHQTRRQRVKRRDSRVFWVRVYNDGTRKNSITLNGTRPAPRTAVRYFARGSNISRAMRNDGWTLSLKPGENQRVKVWIKVGRLAEIGSRKRAKVTATWTGDSTRKDTVRAIVKVVS